MPADLRVHRAQGCLGVGGQTAGINASFACLASLRLYWRDMGAFHAFRGQRVNLNSSYYVCLYGRK